MFAVVQRGRCTLLQTWAMRSLNLAFPLRADDRWFAPPLHNVPTESRPNPEGIPMCSKDIPRYPEGESRQCNDLDDTSYACPVKPSRNSVFSGYWGNSLILQFLTYNVYG